MRQVLERDELHEALTILAQLIPITSDTKLYIEALEKQVRVSVVGENNGAYAVVKAIVTHKGAELVSFTTFAVFIKTLPDTLLHMETKGAYCIVKNEKTQAKFRTYDSDTYTSAYSLKQQTTHNLFTLTAKDLKAVVDDVAFAADKKGDRGQFLTCMCLQPTQDGIDFVATNGFVMAHKMLSCAHTMNTQLLIPASEMKSFASNIKPTGTPITCEVSENGNIIGLSDDIFSYFTRALGGMYPMFHYVYPLTYTLSVTLPTQELLASITSARSFAVFVLTLDIDQTNVTVRFPGTEEGESVTVVPASIKGDPTKITLSAENIHNILHHVKHENVTLVCDPTGPRHGVVFVPGDQRVRYTIIPIGGNAA